jgi:hypothetical protein
MAMLHKGMYVPVRIKLPAMFPSKSITVRVSKVHPLCRF